ncbi:MAG: hypothetical protein PWP63_2262 [Methanolobus sp.]|jgi:hypothetical protein|nr:hypothetical protein [Methanolobus sp.]
MKLFPELLTRSGKEFEKLVSTRRRKRVVQHSIYTIKDTNFDAHICKTFLRKQLTYSDAIPGLRYIYTHI